MPSIRKASGYCTSLSPKYIKGTGMPGMSLHVDAWHVHQCEHGKGKGTERMLMLLSPCSAAQVMGLEGCVGVHSTSRPPQKDLCFPVFLVNLRYLIKEVLWLNQRRVKSVSVCIARNMG